MKTMKRNQGWRAALLALTLMIVSPLGANAMEGTAETLQQQAMTQQQTTQQQPAKAAKATAVPLRTALMLQPQQQEKMQAIIRKANEQIQKEKDSTHISSIPLPLTKIHAKNKAEKLQKDIAAIRKQALVEMRSTLEPAQQPAFDAVCDKRTKDGAAQAEFLQSLNLGRKQKVELAKIGEATKTQTWQLLGDNTLQPEQAARKMQDVQKTSLDNIRKQLDDKQRASFDQWLFAKQQQTNA